MLFNPAQRQVRPSDRASVAPAPDLIDRFLACLPQSCKPGTRERVEQLLAVGAWTDAVLALVERELPGWQLRRLVYDEGEWQCSLSRAPHLPCECDDSADAHHEIAAFAIWNAFLEARGRLPEPRTSVPPARRIQPTGYAVSCDNFS